MPDEPLWTASDVVRFLSVSERTVRACQLDHKLPFLKISGTVRSVPNETRVWALSRGFSQARCIPLDQLTLNRSEPVVPPRRWLN